MKLNDFKTLIREVVDEVLSASANTDMDAASDPKVKLACKTLAKAKIAKADAEEHALGDELNTLKTDKSKTVDPSQKRQVDDKIKSVRNKLDLKRKEKSAATAEYSTTGK
jgi:hypothetical protein